MVHAFFSDRFYIYVSCLFRLTSTLFSSSALFSSSIFMYLEARWRASSKVASLLERVLNRSVIHVIGHSVMLISLRHHSQRHGENCLKSVGEGAERLLFLLRHGLQVGIGDSFLYEYRLVLHEHRLELVKSVDCIVLQPRKPIKSSSCQIFNENLAVTNFTFSIFEASSSHCDAKCGHVRWGIGFSFVERDLELDVWNGNASDLVHEWCPLGLLDDYIYFRSRARNSMNLGSYHSELGLLPC